MSFDSQTLFLGRYCLAEISKNIDGELVVLDRDQKTCPNPVCDSLTLVQSLRLNLHSNHCDSSLGAILEGMIRVWNLTTVFAGAKETLLKGQARVPGSGKILWGLGIASVLEGNTAQAADQFERAKICRDECQSGHPRRNGTRGREKVRRRLHVARQHPADADDKGDVGQQNGVIYPGEVNGLHRIGQGFNDLPKRCQTVCRTNRVVIFCACRIR